MKHTPKQAWDAPSAPQSPPETRKQVAALCYKKTDAGKKVLLITSRDTGRWIIPKGWPMEDKTDAEAALQEAWEEAGVNKAHITKKPLGTFEYDKGMGGGESIPIETTVFLTRVKSLKKRYPETSERKRKWFTPAEAATLVREPQLKEILLNF